MNFFKKGVDCCSNEAIGFHNVKKYELYKMEYFLYEATPFRK